jgi:hypothetical protein
MSIQQQSPMSRTSITVVFVLLCAVGFAYSQGWFDWSRPRTEIESNKVSTNQALEHQNTTEEDAVKATPQALERAATPTK